jgi:tRNA (guanine37-N1)-methyltransferase
VNSYCVLTIFPGIFTGFLSESLVGKAVKRNLCSIELINPRDFSDPPHHKVDDSPYGGGAGMVMKPEPIARAIRSVKQRLPHSRVVYLSPAGAQFNQRKAEELSALESLVFLCGRYEGVDQRVIDTHVDEEISLGNYILMGGEVAAMAVIESCLRLIPGVLGNENSTDQESFSLKLGAGQWIEAPQYTRPEIFEEHSVPEILLSGNHKLINEWRIRQAELRSMERKK